VCSSCMENNNSNTLLSKRDCKEKNVWALEAG
jgi:hypothetical protein